MDRFERRLERILREIGRVILQATLRQLGTDRSEEMPARVHWQGRAYRRNRRTNKTFDTRFGQVTLARWFFQSVEPGEPGIAPLDLRLGLVAGRMTPATAVAVTGHLFWTVADLMARWESEEPRLEIARSVWWN